jgi:Rieske Fe-S protein
MFRKIAAALVVLTLAVGSVFADSIKGTFVKFADGKLTIKADGKEKEFKVPADAKQKTKKGEVLISDVLGKAKEGAELTVEFDKDTVTKVSAEKKKKD